MFDLPPFVWNKNGSFFFRLLADGFLFFFALTSNRLLINRSCLTLRTVSALILSLIFSSPLGYAATPSPLRLRNGAYSTFQFTICPLISSSFSVLYHSLNTLIMHTLQSNSSSKTEIPSFSEKGKANSSGKVPPNRLQKPSSCWMQCLVIITWRRPVFTRFSTAVSGNSWPWRL